MNFFNKIIEITQVTNGKSGVNLLLQKNLEICANTKHRKGLEAKNRFPKENLLSICKSVTQALKTKASCLVNFTKADFLKKIWSASCKPYISRLTADLQISLKPYI